MSGRDAVDVLAVMKTAVKDYEEDSYFRLATQMNEATEAVAKLIEAAHASLAHDTVFDNDHEERLRAALARCGGAK